MTAVHGCLIIIFTVQFSPPGCSFVLRSTVRTKNVPQYPSLYGEITSMMNVDSFVYLFPSFLLFLLFLQFVYIVYSWYCILR